MTESYMSLLQIHSLMHTPIHDPNRKYQLRGLEGAEIEQGETISPIYLVYQA
jgi:hypothetical protein